MGKLRFIIQAAHEPWGHESSCSHHLLILLRILQMGQWPTVYLARFALHKGPQFPSFGQALTGQLPQC